jgi:hypothetical protein
MTNTRSTLPELKSSITRLAISRARDSAVAPVGAWSKLVTVARRRVKYWLPLRPMIRSDTSVAPDSSPAANRSTALTTLALNAPAWPRSLVTTTIAALTSGRSSNSLCESLPATADSSLTTLASAVEYGRAAISASCARRSFAVDTSFIARVILRVFLTLVIRLRIALRLGMGYFFSSTENCLANSVSASRSRFSRSPGVFLPVAGSLTSSSLPLARSSSSTSFLRDFRNDISSFS